MTNNRGRNIWNALRAAGRWLLNQLKRLFDWITRKKEQPPLYSPEEIREKRERLSRLVFEIGTHQAEGREAANVHRIWHDAMKRTDAAAKVTRSDFARKKLNARFKQEETRAKEAEQRFETAYELTRDKTREAWGIIKELEQATGVAHDEELQLTNVRNI